MSISTAQKARLGLFVIISIVTFFMIIIVGLGIKLTEKSATYYSVFEGESLSGLSKGMEVKFRGIPIGKVTDISYNPKDLTKVKVQFSVDKKFPMMDDMVAETGMLGITGLKYIELMGGKKEAKRLPEGSTIQSKPSLMASITDQAEMIFAKVDTLLSNLNTVTNPDSLKNVNVILENVANLSQNLNEVLVQSTPRIDSMSGYLNSTLAKVDNMVTEFQENSNLTKMIDDVDSTILSLKELTSGLNLTFRQSKEDLTSTMIDLQTTMENLNDLTQLLVENPSLLLRGSPQAKRKIK